MEAASLAFSVAQTLFAALQCKELKEICSLWNCESDLESLRDTVNAIKCVLLDAEAKQVLNNQQLNYVEKLKAAVYDADDLLDEFTAMAEQQQHLLDSGIVPKKVRILFSRFGKLGVFRKMSKSVKKIRKELDGIATNASQFSFKVDYEPIRRRREDTYSYVHEKNVIGREKETEELISMLLAPGVEDLSVIAIVGMGGLGKTTLAQHVYEHDKVKNEFSLRLWACVSDEDLDQLLLHPILAKLLESATHQHQECNGTGINLLQTRLRAQLRGKKYLLVLDDVWIEKHIEWLKLKNLLMEGGKGSRIIVTTRSEKTAQAVGSISPYKLKGLSDENSRRLFESVAFEGREGQGDRLEQVDIGKKIVKKCSNVPLSIRVVGSLLRGQEKKYWLELQQCGLADIIQRDNTVMPILKLSYYHLQPAMRSCFSYCALFPKDSVIEKETLISLWMAQGYVEPLHEGQSIEDAGEDYFLILLRRCFFQDVIKNEVGQIVWCKMHDLVHDMAQQVAGKEICVADSTTCSLDENVHHVSHASYNNKDARFFSKTKIRTYLQHKMIKDEDRDLTFPVISAISTKWKCLRVLKLRYLEREIESLPDSIGKLLHLRYLDLSYNTYLKMLPESITQLHYLQTLILKWCENLKELPEGLSKLGKLRLLDTEYCGLSCMPSGMDKLTNLHRLTDFVVCNKNLGTKEYVGNLEDLRALKDLKGDLTITLKPKFRYVKEENGKGGYLSNKEHLTAIAIKWKSGVYDHEGLLEDLQPHNNLKYLHLEGYRTARMPRWAAAVKLQTSLPNLVKICIHGSSKLQELPSFSKLQHLKDLRLSELHWLKYVEETTRSAEAPFFPSLEKLELYHLKKLEGWWRGSVAGVVDTPVRTGGWASFPRLLELVIVGCPDLKTIHFCPTVETVSLYEINQRLPTMIADEEEEVVEKEASCYSEYREQFGSLRRVVIDNVGCLKSLLPLRKFQSLKEMIICGDEKMENLSQIEEVFRSCSSSLRFLGLRNLHRLKILSEGEGGRGGLENLTALESLELFNLPNLEGLPKEISCLSSLRSLCIQQCDRIESLPGSMQQLTSLTNLQIWNNYEHLHERCQGPDGKDWPNIQHISHICIGKRQYEEEREDIFQFYPHFQPTRVLYLESNW